MPFLHVGLFKRLDLVTSGSELKHERVLTSSATSSGIPSRVALDAHSSRLQSASTQAILESFLGNQPRPLLVLDAVSSLRRRGGVSARVAAALSLRPLATEIDFVLGDPDEPASMNWTEIARIASGAPQILVYGFTYMLWRAWVENEIPADARDALTGTEVQFVHSGGWKKLEALSIPRERLDSELLARVGPGSGVLDYYGLVEQVGVIYPLCASGFRHVPIWADVRVRDSVSLAPLCDQVGQLQLVNALAWGAPYHSVLTEDLGRIVPGDCACGRSGPRFELHGRVPRAELRGCANV
ncbi:LuxE/PaaK family acyltransferase [Mycolicibacterium sp. Dal123E01]|uniref:LuxE/PaaK family acyltransferase n=1 Tax=Mycolicibacterium sp. Dal123E01 TaxID=3457578 RepID=UPI00403E4897